MKRKEWHKKKQELAEFFYSELDNSNGGHVKFILPDGQQVIASNTPSDSRALPNAISVLERVSGKKLPRSKSGKYRHIRQGKGFANTMPSRLSKASRGANAAVERVKQMDRQIAEWLRNPPSQSEARACERFIRERNDLATALRRGGFDVSEDFVEGVSW